MNVLLPFPPGLNNLFSNVPRVGRVPTKRYKAWQQEAAYGLLQQHVGHVAGDVDIEVLLGRPDKRKRDLDGLAKAPLDFLVKHGVIEDDSRVQKLTLEWSADTNACLVIVSRAQQKEAA
jgi:crossover junction endodeoxyribonuclease RusA